MDKLSEVFNVYFIRFQLTDAKDGLSILINLI